MRLYSKFSPTAYDTKGLGLEDRQEWLVLDVSRTRDSGISDESNFDAALKSFRAIDAGEIDHEVHRFGHWGPGWFEIILIRPESACEAIGHDIEAALDSYPILDDDDHSRRECELAEQTWERMSVKERVSLCQNADVCIFAARRDEMPEDHNGRLWEYLSREC